MSRVHATDPSPRTGTERLSEREQAWQLGANAVCLARCPDAFWGEDPLPRNPRYCPDYPGEPYREPVTSCADLYTLGIVRVHLEPTRAERLFDWLTRRLPSWETVQAWALGTLVVVLILAASAMDLGWSPW